MFKGRFMIVEEDRCSLVFFSSCLLECRFGVFGDFYFFREVRKLDFYRK